MKIQDADDEFAFVEFDSEDFLVLLATLEMLHDNDNDWEHIMNLCFLGAAISAHNGGMTADEFMIALRGVRVTEEGYSGDA